MTAKTMRLHDQARDLYERPLLDLVFEAAGVHRTHHDPRAIQRCALLRISVHADRSDEEVELLRRTLEALGLCR
ncbi:MAG: hypothetical protein ACYTDU_20860 [Planctomycetota bacterium]|jgi:biotin synthase-like enzyme